MPKVRQAASHARWHEHEIDEEHLCAFAIHGPVELGATCSLRCSVLR